MKMFYEDPTIEVILFDIVDVITSSFMDGDEYFPGIDDDILWEDQLSPNS